MAVSARSGRINVPHDNPRRIGLHGERGGREQTGTRERTNKNGGAIAIGHPLGASGARIVTTLVNALEQRGGRYGLQTMLEGGGVANATIIARLA
jgi:acetyl-CoA acyltransferase